MQTTGADAPIPRVPGPAPRILIVEARFYEAIADELLAGARAVLDAAGCLSEVVTVPGALEIPAVIAMALRAPHEVRQHTVYDGYVVLGCVIRGETGHYDIVAGESNRALMQLVLRDGIALGNGILTVETEAQALARARVIEMDKGGGAARACLALVAIQRRFGLDPVMNDPLAGFDFDDDGVDVTSMLDDIVDQAGKNKKRKRP